MFRRLALLLAAVVALSVAPAHAQDAIEATTDPLKLFELGQSLYGEGKYEDSYRAYLKAWQTRRSYEIAGNLGNVELKLGKYTGAVVHLQYVLDNLPVTTAAEERELVVEKTTERLNEAKSKVAIIKLALSPDGASVSLDGQPLGNAPLAEPLILDPGPHKLVVTLAGHDDVTHDIAAQPGDNETLRIAMVKSGSGEVAEIGTSSGDRADDGPNYILVIAGGVIGLGAVGAGIALHVAAAGKSDDREALVAQIGDTSACSGNAPPPQCAEITDISDQESTFSGAGTGLLIGGGVVLVATALYWFWPRGGGDDQAPAEALLPTFAPGYAGLTYSARF